MKKRNVMDGYTLMDKIYVVKEICRRLPWGIYAWCVTDGKVIEIRGVRMVRDEKRGMDSIYAYIEGEDGSAYKVDEVRPYLKSFERMNEGERKKFDEMFLESRMLCGMVTENEMDEFFIRMGIDDRGMIKNGLFLEAPEEFTKYVNNID